MTSVKLGEWLAGRRKWLVTLATFVAGTIALINTNVTGPAFWLGEILLALNSAGVHQISNQT